MIRKLPQGESVLLNASTFNRFVDAAAAVEQAQRSGAAGSLGFTPQTSIVLLKNGSGAAVNRWGLLHPTAPVISPATNEAGFLDQILMNAGAPAKKKIAFVALEPIPAGEIGRCMAPGVVVPVRIQKAEDTDYPWARASTSTSSLDGVELSDIQSEERVFEVLWIEGGTGEKWGLILMPGVQSARLTVIGPCGAYTPEAELPDTNFDTPYPGGCVGPDVLGLNLKNATTGAVTIIRMEVTGTSPLTFESVDTFTLTCNSSTKTAWAKVVFNDLDRSSGESPGTGVVGTLHDDDNDDAIIESYVNSMYSWNSQAGGNLQLGPGATSCDCDTLPYDLCFSIPSR